jgi:PHO85 cyclin-6/7
MGSVVVSDVVNHFPSGYTNMFGGAHHSSQDSQSSPYHNQQHQQPQHSTPSWPSSHGDTIPSSHQPRSHPQQPHADTPMSDALSRSSSVSGRSARSHQTEYASSARSSNSNPIPNALQHLQNPASRPPPSPRFRGHLAQHPLNSNNPNFNYAPSSAQSSPSQSVLSIPPAPPSPTNRIKVRSLSHIQSFAQDAFSPLSRSRMSAGRLRKDASDVGTQYEISEMPVADVIEMVAGLLTKITTTNDRQHEHIHRQIPPPEGTAGLSQQTNSVLAFHGKNVPQISILSYLSRIHKYCPTTYEVFLSLLVYFDRMTERVNAGPMEHMKQQTDPISKESQQRARANSETTLVEDVDMDHKNQPPAPTPPPSGSLGKPAEPTTQEGEGMDVDNYNISHFFVVDSYNIHRLVIAGVTCASKFFSDIFYTNSRYAKVSG